MRQIIGTMFYPLSLATFVIHKSFNLNEAINQIKNRNRKKNAQSLYFKLSLLLQYNQFFNNEETNYSKLFVWITRSSISVTQNLPY